MIAMICFTQIIHFKLIKQRAFPPQFLYEPNIITCIKDNISLSLITLMRKTTPTSRFNYPPTKSTVSGEDSSREKSNQKIKQPPNVRKSSSSLVSQKKQQIKTRNMSKLGETKGKEVQHIFTKSMKAGKITKYRVQWKGDSKKYWVREDEIPASIIREFNEEVIDLDDSSSQEKQKDDLSVSKYIEENQEILSGVEKQQSLNCNNKNGNEKQIQQQQISNNQNREHSNSKQRSFRFLNTVSKWKRGNFARKQPLSAHFRSKMNIQSSQESSRKECPSQSSSQESNQKQPGSSESLMILDNKPEIFDSKAKNNTTQVEKNLERIVIQEDSPQGSEYYRQFLRYLEAEHEQEKSISKQNKVIPNEVPLKQSKQKKQNKKKKQRENEEKSSLPFYLENGGKKQKNKNNFISLDSDQQSSKMKTRKKNLTFKNKGSTVQKKKRTSKEKKIQSQTSNKNQGLLKKSKKNKGKLVIESESQQQQQIEKKEEKQKVTTFQRRLRKSKKIEKKPKPVKKSKKVSIKQKKKEKESRKTISDIEISEPVQENQKKKSRKQESNSFNFPLLLEKSMECSEEWQEFEQCVKYVTNAMVINGEKYFTLKLRSNSQVVEIHERDMKYYFPRKLGQFYEQILRQTTRSTLNNIIF